MLKRLFHWYRLFRRSVWPLFAIPFAILANLFSVRDEFLPPDIAAKLKMPEWLPHFPWYYWTIFVLILVVIAILEGAYQEHADLMKRLAAVSEPTQARAIEAQEAHTRALEENARANDPFQRVVRERFANQLFGESRPVLKLSVGNEKPLTVWHHDALWHFLKTCKIKVENGHAHKPISQCKLTIEAITPDAGVNSPRLLKENIALAAGECAYVDLLTFREAAEPQKGTVSDTQVRMATKDGRLSLGVEQPSTIRIRATSPDIQFQELSCRVTVHGGLLYIEQI